MRDVNSPLSKTVISIRCLFEACYIRSMALEPLTGMSTRYLPGEGVKRGRRLKLTTSPPYVDRFSRQFVILDMSRRYGPSLPTTGIALVFTYIYRVYSSVTVDWILLIQNSHVTDPCEYCSILPVPWTVMSLLANQNTVRCIHQVCMISLVLRQDHA
jgi:hypothetical protein